MDSITQEKLTKATLTGEVHSSSESARAREIWNNAQQQHTQPDNLPLLCLYLNEWSDGFDPMSASKCNRGSAWVKTITISPTASSQHSLANTYPIAVGSSADSHEEVEEKFKNELLQLRRNNQRTYYCAALKKNVRVHLELFVSLQDQPERRSCNSLMLGSGNYGARWGYSSYYGAVATKIPACLVCHQNLLQNIIPTTTCTVCANWDTATISGVLDFDPPVGVPRTAFTLSDGKLKPVRLSYDVLKCAVDTAHGKLAEGKWSKAVTEKYLRVFSISTTSMKKILECATNANELVVCAKHPERDPAGYQRLLQDQILQPHLYKWPHPAVWSRGVDLHQHVDAPMHLLFLGVVKTTISKLQDWLVKRGVEKKFLRHADLDLLTTIKGLHLEWCKSLQFTGGTLGGWVLENHLAMARLFNWFYEPILVIAPDDKPYVPPGTEPNNWTMLENKDWLRARRLKTGGFSIDLKARVSDYLNRADGQVPAVVPQYGGAVINIHLLINALTCLLLRLMGYRYTTKERILDIERHIKFFLSTFDEVDKSMRQSDKTPHWLSAYNFMCLMNLPATIRRFGPICTLWEGGGQGEKFLTKVKPHFYGFTLNWQSNLLEHMLKDVSIKRIKERLDKQYNNKPDDVVNSKNKNYETYKNRDSVIEILDRKQPLSAVCMRDGSYKCILSGRRFVKLIRYDYNASLQSAGKLCCYFNWGAQNANDGDDDNNASAGTTISDDDITHYCLLLPKINVSNNAAVDTICVYTIITSEWLVLDADGVLRLPKVIGATYS